MTYQRQDCVVIVTGRAWAEDNGRTYGDPEDVGENAVAYINVSAYQTASYLSLASDGSIR